jgi:kynureninase
MPTDHPAATETNPRDAQDSLRHFRDRFHFPKTDSGREPVYFTGNSLGLQPKSTRDEIEKELSKWADLAVEGHFLGDHPWVSYHERVRNSLASLTGALPLEVAAMNQLTVNLHLLMVSFYRPDRERYKIIIEHGAFPSDRFAVMSQIAFHGFDPSRGLVELKPREGEHCLRIEDIERELHIHGKQTALILLGGVNFYTGQLFDMERITAEAKRQGIAVGFDLAHAIGNVPLRLHDWGVDFAAWCSYKYLNAGPGGVAGAFVHERHSENKALPRFAGWWGHNLESRFEMGRDFAPIPGADGWQLSNAAVLNIAALRASLDLFDEAGLPALFEKSRALTGYLEERLREISRDHFEILTPENPEERGCQLSLKLSKGDKSVFDRLLANDIFADWREPGVIRVAPVPLYNSFEDVDRFCEIFKTCL